ncbi:MAG: hypothetical protein OEV08_12330, partial [Nitrospira sp.]|nr:hypothetical protein [Nitrospira sp.]
MAARKKSVTPAKKAAAKAKPSLRPGRNKSPPQKEKKGHTPAPHEEELPVDDVEVEVEDSEMAAEEVDDEEAEPGLVSPVLVASTEEDSAEDTRASYNDPALQA